MSEPEYGRLALAYLERTEPRHVVGPDAALRDLKMLLARYKVEREAMTDTMRDAIELQCERDQLRIVLRLLLERIEGPQNVDDNGKVPWYFETPVKMAREVLKENPKPRPA